MVPDENKKIPPLPGTQTYYCDKYNLIFKLSWP